MIRNPSGGGGDGPSLRVRALRSLNDEKLAALCLLGMEDAWKVLIERYAPLIYSVARRTGLKSADADDVFQDVCVALCRHLDEIKEAGKLPAWLITTTNRAVWRLSRRRRETQFLDTEIAEGVYSETPEHVVIGELERWQVFQELRSLPERCRELLTMLYVADPAATYLEVEQALAIPLNSISPTRVRCLQKLKKALESQELE